MIAYRELGNDRISRLGIKARRMIIALIIASLTTGIFGAGLPEEGEPDIMFISCPSTFPQGTVKRFTVRPMSGWAILTA